MKFKILFCLILFSSIINAQVFDKIEKINKKISSSKTITLEEQIEIDRQIMELQFDEMNQLFEEMRTKLFELEVVDDVIIEDEVVDATPIITKPNENNSFTVEQKILVNQLEGKAKSTIKGKYTVADLKKILKIFDLKVSGKKDVLVDRVYQFVN